MDTKNLANAALLSAVALWLTVIPAVARGGEPAGWSKERAGQYLDERQKVWFAFPAADRGKGAKKTSCVSCHTVVPYVLARPALRKLAGTSQPSPYQEKLLAQAKTRVEHWKELDAGKFGLFYDFNDQKKKESWGTEAVFNALILALDDHCEGRGRPSDITTKAFANLWQAQVADGDQKGSWEWLDFDSEPWESKRTRYFGAALAAIAVGTAPGYYHPGKDAALDKRVGLLQGYLRNQGAAPGLYNRVWLLWAAAKLDGLLTKEEQRVLIRAVLDKQRADGGWSLPSLGTFARKDGTALPTDSDGYATGLILHVLQVAGVDKQDAKLVKGLAWLASHQAATGAWLARSVNKERNPATHVGKFMSDAATAYAVLALSH